jgi:hypothetical protein
MSNVKRFVTCFCLTVGIATVCHGQGWRGIVPLHSTRQDVERLIGRPTESNGITYNLKTERVSIFYSGGACVKGWPYGRNVANDVVIKVVSYPQTRLTLDQLGIDIKAYIQTRNIQLGGADYTNKDAGISIGVKENGEVEVVQYEPSAKDKNLLCPDAAERERQIESGRSAYVAPVLYYFNVSPKEEAVRLEFFADQLKKHPPESKIYIIGYAGSEDCPNGGIIRANRVRDQLVAKLKVDRKRIATIDGGRNSAVWIELYVIRPGGPRPLSTPDINPALAKSGNCSSPSKTLENRR